MKIQIVLRTDQFLQLLGRGSLLLGEIAVQVLQFAEEILKRTIRLGQMGPVVTRLTEEDRQTIRVEIGERRRMRFID